MSLTSILDSPQGKELVDCFRELKPHLKIYTPKGLKWGASPLVSPIRTDGSYPGLVGTTWDYWVRLWLSKYHNGVENGLIAEEALKQFPVKLENLRGMLLFNVLAFEEADELAKDMMELQINRTSRYPKAFVTLKCLRVF